MRLAPVLGERHTRTRLVKVGVIAMFCLLAISLVAQDGDRTSQLKGKTRQINPVPNGTVDAGDVLFKKDSDNDGMPDADEIANGTNPNDSSDADADNDGDGVSNADEIAVGSNPNASDTDGDGVSDAEELRLGYDPTDPNSTPPSGATLSSLQISPSSVSISINSVLGQQPVQLRVSGVLSDGTTVNLTGSPTLTYQSSDTNVALADDFGFVVGIGAGTTNIRVQSGTIFSDVTAVITTIAPGPLSAINIPGYANNVDVAGNYAYVAAGSAGLVVVDVTDKSNPLIVATLDTPGNANDVKVNGNKAYVADGSSGLQIIDLTTPASPSILGSLDTPGEAYDVVVYGPLVYLADGSAGLQIVDVSNPSAPTTIGSVATSGGQASGVDVSGDFAVVTDGRSIRIIDVSIPASPAIVGSVTLPSGGALDLEVRNRFAYVATLGQGFLTVDFSIPTAPQIVDREIGFNLHDVAVSKRCAVAAELAFANFVPIFDLDDPGNALFRAGLNPSFTESIRGTGIALTEEHIYMTGSTGAAFNNGVSGVTRLFILAYQDAAPQVSDTAGIAPTVTIDAPQSGQSITAGDPLPISITATDDVQVASVQLIVNGVVVIQDSVAPYNITYTVPHGVTTLVIEARAIDTAGNAATSPPVTVNVVPDPPPSVSIFIPEEGQTLFERQEIFLVADANDNRPVSQLSFTVNGEPRNNFSFFIVPIGVTSLTFVATATDDFGQTTSTTRTVSVVPDSPPTISIVTPAAGTELTEGQVAEFVVNASDNLFVQRVEFSINGEISSDFEEPYRQSYAIPVGTTSLAFEATAYDGLGQSTTVSRTFTVIPDPGTTVVGRVLDTAGQPVTGATAKVGTLTTTTGADGHFTIPDVPTAEPNVLVRVTATIGGQAAANASLPTPRVSAGTTDVGDITLSVGPTAPTAFAISDYDGDFIPDVFVGFADRQSWIYSFDVTSTFTPNTNVLLPFGAVSSAANLDLNFGTQRELFAQLSDRPGSVTEVAFEGGSMFAPKTLTTGLADESDYVAAGLDTSSGGDQDSRKGSGVKTASVTGSSLSVLAFLTNGPGGTSLKVRFGDNSDEGFGAPLTLPVDPGVQLRSLTLADVNSDGFMDVIVVKPESGTGAKVVVYLRTSASTFGDPIESQVFVRAAVPARGAVDLVFGNLAGDSNKDIAVLGNDRVQIYQGDGDGGFAFVREVVLPAARIATGLAVVDVSHDGRSDIIVTASDTTIPTSKEALVYLNTFSGSFLSPTITSYTAPVNSGDTRLGVGNWGGNFRQLDLVVVDGDSVTVLFDIGPESSGS